LSLLIVAAAPDESGAGLATVGAAGAGVAGFGVAGLSVPAVAGFGGAASGHRRKVADSSAGSRPFMLVASPSSFA
jgi:hypothetical protein